MMFSCLCRFVVTWLLITKCSLQIYCVYAVYVCLQILSQETDNSVRGYGICFGGKLNLGVKATLS